MSTAFFKGSWERFTGGVKSRFWAILMFIILESVLYTAAPALNATFFPWLKGGFLNLITTFREPWTYNFLYSPIGVAIPWLIHNFRNRGKQAMATVEPRLAAIETRVQDIWELLKAQASWVAPRAETVEDKLKRVESLQEEASLIMADIKKEKTA